MRGKGRGRGKGGEQDYSNGEVEGQEEWRGEMREKQTEK